MLLKKCSNLLKQNRVYRKCIICGKEFAVRKSVLKYSKAICCSRECFYQYNKKPPNFTCKICGNQFRAKPSLIEKNKVKYCSRECSSLAQSFISKDNHYNWKGGISSEPYCPEFNEIIKEKIRNKWNRKCAICNKLEKNNGQRLSVHHVNYNKNQGCDENFMLIPLCKKCHSKTNYNRKKWQEKCTEIYNKKIGELTCD